MERANLTKMFLLWGTISNWSMNNFLKYIMEANVFCSLVINNVATTLKRNQHLRSHYTIFTKVVNEVTQVHLL